MEGELNTLVGALVKKIVPDIVKEMTPAATHHATSSESSKNDCLLAGVGKGHTSEVRQASHFYPCKRCGSFSPDLDAFRRHVEWGCPFSPLAAKRSVYDTDEEEEEDDERNAKRQPPRKKSKEMRPTELWLDWVMDTGNSLENVVKALEKQYRKKGFTKEEAYSKALKDHLCHHKAGLAEMYGQHLKLCHGPDKDPIHECILEDIKSLVSKKGYTWEKATEEVLSNKTHLSHLSFMCEGYIDVKTDKDLEDEEQSEELQETSDGEREQAADSIKKRLRKTK